MAADVSFNKHSNVYFIEITVFIPPKLTISSNLYSFRFFTLRILCATAIGSNVKNKINKQPNKQTNKQKQRQSYYVEFSFHYCQTVNLFSCILFTDSEPRLDFFETLKKRYPESYPLLYTDLIIDVLFMIDILMNFRTTYVKEGEVLITNPWKIAVHYLKTYFLVDFVAAIPWDLLASFNSGTEEVSFSK